MNLRIKQGDVVLFQGDSITDTGRNRELPNDLGNGYAFMAAALFSSAYPHMQVKFWNRGIGGNRTRDLLDRWEADCLELRPSWVSILIGINETWRRYSRNDSTSTKQFEKEYRQLLILTKERSDASILMLEPFVLPVPEDRKMWREDLDPKITVVRELAREFGALLIPLDGMFAQASMLAPAAFWAHDGIHPSPCGHALIAKAWLGAMGADRALR
ncbi:SGNH/GDSL hydrolase family protein [Paenibacillus oceani]|uniref:SGNH/GDSL hydrolase family protein n=1 Tax=Paenibacillus oceani TaxID=2772510 RepID=A0A927CA82_9BACL|nr:SGNH/GDSL hydrolase family protein [Paenibacillus oceani]MBD2862867.1 SGNH/GDSL hydrolase family protein [Paenibacillus oceani]